MQMAGGHGFYPTGVAGVAMIDLGRHLVAREPHLRGVDHHDMVATVHVRGEGALVLAP